MIRKFIQWLCRHEVARIREDARQEVAMAREGYDNFMAHTPKVHHYARLTGDMLDQFVRKANATCICTSQTTDIQAGFQLGVAHSERILRENFSIASQ